MSRSMRFIGLVALAGALTLVSGPGRATDAQGKFAVKGAGAVPCSAFVEARTRRLYVRLATFEGWLYGYLTGYDRLVRDTFDVAPWQSTPLLMGALQAYCSKHPRERFEIAVAGLVNTLRPERIRKQSEIVRVKEGARTLTLYREVVVRVQKALAQSKIYAGKADGKFGDETKRAIAAFQKREKLPATGLPDQRTLLALLPMPRHTRSR